MPRITRIKPQKKSGRVNVFLDGKFGFGLDLDNFVRFGLKLEQELSEEKIEEIVKKAEFQKTYEKLLRFATLRPRSKKEVNDWFKRRKVHSSLTNNLLLKIKKLDLLNDEAFTRWWVEQRTTFKPRGAYALKSELRQKGIDKNIIDEVVEGLNLNEGEIAKALLKKKMYIWRKMGKKERKEKMTVYLSRRGFGWEAIEKAVRKL